MAFPRAMRAHVARLMRVCGVASVVMTAPAQAAPLRNFTESGKWNVQYNETACQALLEYGAAGDGVSQEKMTLLLKYSPSGNVMALHLYRSSKMRAQASQKNILLGFDDRPPTQFSALRYGTTGTGQKWLIDQINLGPAAIAQLRKSRRMTTLIAGTMNVFPLPAMAQVVASLDKCRGLLMAHWNIDAAALRRAQGRSAIRRVATPVPEDTPGRPPMAIRPPYTLFSSDDYPTAALDADQSGVTHAELLIDEAGTVKECFINGTSGVATLDVMTCLKLLKARYHPALDANARPTRSYDDVRINWIVR